jgi:hypothetical protein
MCSDGLNVFDVTNPQQPALLGRYTVPKNVRRVQVIGDRAYLFEQPPPNVSLPVFSDPCPWGGNKLWIVDIANAAVPRPIGSYAFGNPCVDLLGIVAQRAYFADQNTIKIVNISTETNPFLETTVAMPVAGTAVQLVGSRAYVINDTRFFIVDISVPTSPMLLGTYNANEQVYSLRVAGSLAYMTTGSSFKVLDVSIPTRPILLNGAAPLIAYGTMEIVGQRVYLEYQSGGALSGSSIGFTTLDVGRPEQPTILATYLSANRVWSYADSSSGRVRVANGLAFIVSGSPNQDSWQIVDITDEAHPRSVGRYRSVGKPHDAQVVGNRFYVVNAGGFQILDFIATMCECSDVYLPLVHA